MGTVLLRGREFAPSEREGAALVAIINQTTANQFWPGQNAVGRRLFEGRPGQGDSYEIVRRGGNRQISDTRCDFEPNQRLMAYNLATGAERWWVGGLPPCGKSTPVIGGGLLFLAASDIILEPSAERRNPGKAAEAYACFHVLTPAQKLAQAQVLGSQFIRNILIIKLPAWRNWQTR